MKEQTIWYERYGDKLNLSKTVWIELSMIDGRYYKEIPEGHGSQGGFSFGKECSIQQLKEK